MPLLLLLACTGGTTDSAAPVAAPTVAWLVPSDGDTVVAGDVACALVFDGFTLEDPAKHGEGAPVGYVAVSVDGTEVLTSSVTNFTLTLAAGPRELVATLYYADGDEVVATGAALCDEGAEDDGCAPVTAAIQVTAE